MYQDQIIGRSIEINQSKGPKLKRRKINLNLNFKILDMKKNKKLLRVRPSYKSIHGYLSTKIVGYSRN